MINRSLAAPEKRLGASPPLTYAAIILSGVAFFVFGLSGVASAIAFPIFYGIAVVLTLRDPDYPYVFLSWVAVAELRLFHNVVTINR